MNLEFFTRKSTWTSSLVPTCFRRGPGPSSELASVSGDTQCASNLCSVLSREQGVCMPPFPSPRWKGLPCDSGWPGPRVTCSPQRGQAQGWQGLIHTWSSGCVPPAFVCPAAGCTRGTGSVQEVVVEWGHPVSCPPGGSSPVSSAGSVCSLT